MNSTSTRETFNFSFKVLNGSLALFSHLKLFDGYNEIVSEAYGGELEVKVKPGLYQLRIEMNEFVEDRHYRITDDVSDSIKELKTESSMPLNGYQSRREYFVQPTEEWSTKSTIDEKILDFGNSLFICLTYSDKDVSFDTTVSAVDGLVIVSQNRKVIHSLNRENTKMESGYHNGHHEHYGTIIFHTEIEPGQYYLIYRKGKYKRELPLYVFRNWTTQLFMSVKDAPVFATARISIGKGRFSYNNSQNIYLDALIQKMHNGLNMLPKKLIEIAAHEKWENPMLGILAAYMYLQTDETKDDTLFKTILNNLEFNILGTPDAPDFIALRLLGAKHFGEVIPNEKLSAPCMLAVGMDAFLKASMTNEKLMNKGSMIEKIFPKLQYESIWTVYEPLPVKVARVAKEQISKDVAFIEFARNKKIRVPRGERRRIAARQFKPRSVDWLTSTIFNQLSIFKGAARKAPLRLDSKRNSKLNPMVQLATELQLPQNTVRTVLSKLQDAKKLSEVAKAVTGDNSIDVRKTAAAISGILKIKK